MNYGKSVLIERMEWFVKHVKIRRCFYGQRQPAPEKDSQCLNFPRVIIPFSGIKRVEFATDGQACLRELLPGDILFLGAYCWKIPCWKTSHEYLSIVFHQNKMLRFIYINHKGDNERGLCDPDEYYHIEDISGSCAIGLIRALEQFSLDKYSERNGLQVCNALVGISLSELKNAEDKPIGKATHTWHRLTQYMQENFTRRIDRSEAAMALRITPEHLSLLFRKFANSTFSSYLNQLRIAHASYLLQDTNLTVDEIAAKCGYGNSQYFIRVFRQKHLMTPTMFRNSLDQ